MQQRVPRAALLRRALLAAAFAASVLAALATQPRQSSQPLGVSGVGGGGAAQGAGAEQGGDPNSDGRIQAGVVVVDNARGVLSTDGRSATPVPIPQGENVFAPLRP